MKPFPQINTADYVINRIQDNVAVTFGQILNKELLDGILIKNIQLTSGVDNIVNHGLGREPQMVVVGSPTAQATIWYTLQNAKYITFRTSANCTVSVWVA